MLIASPLLGSGTILAALFVAFYLAVALIDGIVCRIELASWCNVATILFLGLNEFGTTSPKFCRLLGVRICDGDGIVEKNFWAPGKFCRLLWDQGFEYMTGTGWWKKLFGPPKVFSIATKSGMTASAYLVNFKINLGDLAEVALIWS